MNYLLLLVVSAVTVLGDNPHRRLGVPRFLNEDLSDADYDSCISSANPKISELESFHPGDSVELSENTLCFWKCIADKVKFINSDGTLNTDEFKNRGGSHMSQERRDKILKCVEEITKIETCDDMNKVQMCMKH